MTLARISEYHCEEVTKIEVQTLTRGLEVIYARHRSKVDLYFLKHLGYLHRDVQKLFNLIPGYVLRAHDLPEYSYLLCAFLYIDQNLIDF
jgi:hypothetical protein